ncbi:hypothetical protein [Conexibacter sp. SYSU D00693]|uniref:hypothetical protein n=1 Tax=Conexibacter sp. SYSU D00693 TaxID=2812560 RepID=UPI00196B0C1B|nr:hypothetical protein [Conexibacter sp. SYSU D00693]
MLFDLRGRGRRRTVKVVYSGLALLMGGGLVLFGIGGDVQGGLFDAFREDQQQGQGDKAFEERLERTEKRADTDPRNAAVWAELARLRYQEAGLGENFDQATGTFTDDGRDELRTAVQAWERHVALAKEDPDSNVANLMVQAYSALEDMPKAVASMEIVVDSKKEPTPQLLTQLATLAWSAGQNRKAELVGDRALDLADKADRELIKGQLDSAKQLAQQQQVQKAQEEAGVQTRTGADALLAPGS